MNGKQKVTESESKETQDNEYEQGTLNTNATEFEH